jgi:hypothetical protein
MNKHLSFSNFLKEEESFFSSMNKIGINSDDYKKFPQVASFFDLGLPVNIGSFSILDYIKDKDGKIKYVKIKKINDPKFYSLRFDKNKEGELDKTDKNSHFLVSIEDLESLLLQGQSGDQSGQENQGMM